jgi:hypothetical protein
VEIIKLSDPLLFDLILVVKHCSMMVSFAEGLLLSERVGLDPNTVVEVVLLKQNGDNLKYPNNKESNPACSDPPTGYLTGRYQCPHVLPQGPFHG